MENRTNPTPSIIPKDMTSLNIRWHYFSYNKISRQYFHFSLIFPGMEL